MKKLLLYSFAFFIALSVLSACGGEDDAQDQPAQATMTMFRISEITGMSYPDDSLELRVMGNNIHLHWFSVGDCAGYEIMYALHEQVDSDALAWTNPNYIIKRFTVSPQKVDTLVTDLEYSTDYSFAIRVLSKYGEGYHSEWFGTGTDRQWANICHRTTEAKPDTIEIPTLKTDSIF